MKSWQTGKTKDEQSQNLYEIPMGITNTSAIWLTAGKSVYLINRFQEPNWPKLPIFRL